jgi:hypothetical protein
MAGRDKNSSSALRLADHSQTAGRLLWSTRALNRPRNVSLWPITVPQTTLQIEAR